MDVRKIFNIKGSIFIDALIDRNSVFIFDYHIPFLFRKAIALIVGGILAPCYNFLLFVDRINKKSIKKKFYFSICAIFKNEELSLKQWLEYHLIIGVDHFYLYNNNSSDSYLSILKPYIDKGLVDLIDWPFLPPVQCPAYSDCLQKYSVESQWIAFIDLDEFICPFYEVNIKKWVEKYEKYPSVVIYWKMFGASGKIDHDSSSLIPEQYILCWDKFYDIGKTIVNTNFNIHRITPADIHEIPGSISFCGCKILIPPINEFKKFIQFKSSRLGCNGSNDFTIQLNHYFSKSYGEFVISKSLRGAPTSTGETGKKIRSLSTFYWNQHLCISSDYKIYRFLVDLKVQMGMAKHIEDQLKEISLTKDL